MSSKDRKQPKLRGFPDGDPRNARIATKRAAILDAAREAFLATGYANTTVDAVAERCGVSKMTVYRHFGSKEALFEALVLSLLDDFAFDAPAPVSHGPLAQRLTAFGVGFAEALMRPESLALYRTIVASAADFPELARLFQERGRAAIQGVVAAMLQDELGLENEDAIHRAKGFDALVLGDLFQRCLLGLATPTQQELRRQVAQAVDLAIGRLSGPQD